jgi:hypothetical protein
MLHPGADFEFMRQQWGQPRFVFFAIAIIIGESGAISDFRLEWRPQPIDAPLTGVSESCRGILLHLCNYTPHDCNFLGTMLSCRGGKIADAGLRVHAAVHFFRPSTSNRLYRQCLLSPAHKQAVEITTVS